MQFLTDLERLEAFIGTNVPPAPLTGGPIEHLGPLLVSTRQSFPWFTLKPALEAAFGVPGRVDRQLIGSGWAGLNAVLCAFRRVEAARNEDEAEELRAWLESLEAAVIQQSSFYSDGSGNFEKVISGLNVPKAFISLFTLTPGQGAAVRSDATAGLPPPSDPNSPLHQSRSNELLNPSTKRSSSAENVEMEVDQPNARKRLPSQMLPSIQTQTHLFGPPSHRPPFGADAYHSPFPYPPPQPPYGHYMRGHYATQMAISPVSYMSPTSASSSSVASSRNFSASSIFSPHAPSSHFTTPASSPQMADAHSRAVNLSPLSNSALPRPQLDVSTLIKEAILQSPDQGLSVAQIVSYINEKHPEETRRKKTWEDHVRSALNTSSAFEVRGHEDGPLGMKKRGKIWSVKGEDGHESRLVEESPSSTERGDQETEIKENGGEEGEAAHQDE